MSELPAAVTFRFPLGRYVAGRTSQAWPPDPWRVLAALVDVAGTDPTFDVGSPAVRGLLGRLAAASPPRIDIPRHEVADEVFHWVPRSIATDTARKWDDLVAGPRRTFVAVHPDSGLRYVWPDLVLDGQEQELLQQLVSRVPHLGQSESVVHADAAGTAPLPNTWGQVAPSPDGRLPLRWIDPRAVDRLLVDDPDDPEWGFGGSRRRSIATTVLYGPVRAAGTPRIVVPADGDRPGPCPVAGAVAVRHVGRGHGNGRQLGWMVFDSPPAGWVEPFGAVPKTLQLSRWRTKASRWVSTEPMPVPARPTVQGLRAAEAAGDPTVDGALAWTYLTDPRRRLHLPADAQIVGLVRHRNGQVAGARGARDRHTHLEVRFDRAVPGPVVVNGVLFTQSERHPGG